MRYPDNSRVCFIGDSMTHANRVLSHIVNFYVKNFKESNIQFFNCGTAGARVGFALNNLEEDVFTHNPTHAVVAFGINDSCRSVMEKPRGKECYEVSKQAFETYKKNLKILCDKLSEKNIKITVCTPPPYDEYQKCDTPALRGIYAVMVEYSHFVRKFAAQNCYECCDYNDYLTNLINFEDLYKDDRVHPNDHGYFRMAECFLKQQGLDIGVDETLPENIIKWTGLVDRCRCLYAAENCILKPEQYSLSIEEKFDVINEYIKINSPDSVPKNPEKEYVLYLAREYVKNKPHSEELNKEMMDFYHNEILNGEV